jgi:hypothetical protein
VPNLTGRARDTRNLLPAVASFTILLHTKNQTLRGRNLISLTRNTATLLIYIALSRNFRHRADTRWCSVIAAIAPTEYAPPPKLSTSGIFSRCSALTQKSFRALRQKKLCCARHGSPAGSIHRICRRFWRRR